MIELPEAIELAKQINQNIKGKRILNVIAEQTPHKFAWYYGDPQKYHELLTGKQIGNAIGLGNYVEIKAEDASILFGEGITLRYIMDGEKRPQKHQLLIEFEDFSALVASAQMFGGMWCFRTGELDNKYYDFVKERPSPFDERFGQYFEKFITAPENSKLTAKALLATEQRIPGLGNGVLQDILFNAGVHPKKKVNTFSQSDKEKLLESIKSTLAEMAIQGGRDTEKDLFGCHGGYITKLSKKTVDKPCKVCGSLIMKENFMGGSIYFCPECQAL